MSALTRIFDRLRGRKAADTPKDPSPEPARPHIPTRGAKYDSAQTGDENKNHFAAADYLSANAANTPAVRAVLRIRSRYERANNGYMKGLIRARTNDTIGTGPRLQLDLPEETYDPVMQRTVAAFPPETTPADLARLVERKWYEWCESVGYTDKLRVMADAEDVDGETFAIFTTRETDFPVKLGLRVIECDRVMTPNLLIETPTEIDGIRLDDQGEPVAYTILKQHPGNLSTLALAFSMFDATVYPAGQVIHLFEQDRPEQGRGIPLLTPALQLYPILRRYTLASLGSAELGAMIAGVITNPNGSVDTSGEDAPEFEAMDAIPFARNALLTLPAGQAAEAFDSKNPNTGYAEFKSEVLTEAGRSAGEMRNTATGSSAEYNYSSGRLDHLPRQRGIVIRRERWERGNTDRVFRAWYAEASQIPDYLPAGLPPIEEWEWCWQWDGFPSIDPKKDAEAQQIKKQIGLTTDAAELAKDGIDWREHYRQLAREQAMRDELGLRPPVTPTGQQAAQPDTADATDGEVPAND